MNNFTFGSDPEFMLKRRNKFFSAIGIVNGTKTNKKEVGNYCFFYDNVLAECNVPPGSTKEEVIRNFGGCLQAYADIVRPYTLSATASHYFDRKELNHPEAMEINCNRETCAYEMRVLEPDESLLAKTALRSGGGHVHLGNDLLRLHGIECVRLLDFFLGIPSLFIDSDPSSAERRKLYGKAGRFRNTEYGLEYRSIGNFWLSSPKLVELVYDICAFTIDFIAKDRIEEIWHIDYAKLNDPIAWSEPGFHQKNCYQCVAYNSDDLRLAIDTNNLDKAAGYCEMLKKYMPKGLYTKVVSAATKPKTFDLYKEWKLN